jgi:excisionase family DNA binding protein
MNGDPLHSKRDSARFLGVSVSTLERMIQRGELRRVKVGLRRTLIRESSLIAAIREDQTSEQDRAELLTA